MAAEKYSKNSDYTDRNKELGALLLLYKMKETGRKEQLSDEQKKIVDQIFQENKGLVGKIVKGFQADYQEDLLQVGLMKFYEILPYWDHRVATLGTYIYMPVYGVILGEFRRLKSRGFYDFFSFSSYIQPIKNIGTELRDALGRKPTEEEIANKLNQVGDKKNISPEIVRAIGMIKRCSSYSAKKQRLFEQEDPNSKLPLEQLLEIEMVGNLMEVLSNGVLDEREKHIICEHYFQGRPLSDIRSDFGISVQCTEQLHYRAIVKLQTALKTKYPEIRIRERKKRKSEIE